MEHMMREYHPAMEPSEFFFLKNLNQILWDEKVKYTITFEWKEGSLPMVTLEKEFIIFCFKFN